MRKIKSINELAQDDLEAIYNCLVTFNNYLQTETKEPTDKNVSLYENWIDCMCGIEDKIIIETR